MFFVIENKYFKSQEQLRTSTLMKAYYIVAKYPIHATELAIDTYIQQQYSTNLKNMCINLLLNLTVHKDDAGNLIFLFKDQKYDKIARLITYGNGAIPGSKILQTALKT